MIWAPKNYKPLEFDRNPSRENYDFIPLLKDQCVRCGMFGQAWVGKSCSSMSFISGETFRSDYHPTIEDYMRKEVYVKDWGSVLLEILDTAGNEDFRSLQDTWIRESDVIYFVYDLMNPISLSEISKLYQRCVDVKGKENLLIVLCGNKSDLIGEWGRCPKKESLEPILFELWTETVGSVILDFLSDPPPQGVVSRAEGLALAKKMNAVFFETSALSGEFIKDAFESAITLYIRHKENLNARIADLHFDPRLRSRSDVCCCAIS